MKNVSFILSALLLSGVAQAQPIFKCVAQSNSSGISKVEISAKPYSNADISITTTSGSVSNVSGFAVIQTDLSVSPSDVNLVIHPSFASAIDQVAIGVKGSMDGNVILNHRKDLVLLQCSLATGVSLDQVRKSFSTATAGHHWTPEN